MIDMCYLKKQEKRKGKEKRKRKVLKEKKKMIQVILPSIYF